MEVIEDLFNFDTFRREFDHLKGSCYLDQTGAALYTRSQLESVMKDLSGHLYTNPHSNSLSSKLCADTVDQVRYRLLELFNTTTENYSVIFTSGATEALKVVAETFDFTGKTSEDLQNGLVLNGGYNNACGEFVYLQDNHTSVLGMRNVDNITLRNVPTRCVTQAEAIGMFQTVPSDGVSAAQHSRGNSLFVYPAQCNFSGVKYPLTWVRRVQQGVLENKTDKSARWFCLLDAATYVSTNPLDLSEVTPDFICFSFYKMFGLPTGLGALLVRNNSAPVLRKKYYGGGTVQVALSTQSVHVLRPHLHESFEDGTINFLSIITLRHGLDWWQRAGLTMTTVSHHCFLLARYTHHKLRHLHHANGRPAALLYADTAYDDETTQGGIVNFNLLRDDGQFVGFMEVLNLANLHGIHLRTGCFCNPGACQRHLGMTDQQYYAHFEAGHVCGDDKDLIQGRPTGSVRVSFGPHSRQLDVYKLLHMITECFVSKPPIVKEPDNWEADSELLRNKFTNFNQKPVNTKEENNNVKCKKQPVYNGIPVVINNGPPAEITGTKQLDFRLKLTQVCLYPVKSCGGLMVNRWPLDQRGLRYDRGWMVVTDLGTALTQKHEPRMCLIKPDIDLGRKMLTLTFKGYPSCSVPLHSDESAGVVSSASLCQTKVCGDNVRGVDCGEAVAKWLSHVLGRQGLRLMRQSEEHLRTSRSKRQENGLTSLALSNQAQFLLVNDNSVRWLSDKLPDQSDCSKDTLVDRFRSNFVVQGDCPAFEERNWTEVAIGCINFKVDGPCGRCQMICIDQSTGGKTKEPLTTLAANCQGSMKFGIYLSQMIVSDDVFISVGDPVIPSVR